MGEFGSRVQSLIRRPERNHGLCAEKDLVDSWKGWQPRLKERRCSRPASSTSANEIPNGLTGDSPYPQARK
ncbi:MAG: hypothetical protein JWN70_3116 [Planctomycetaceae bacterium]|nr:hypothetical protein [Planctomycetaceae bacterium]